MNRLRALLIAAVLWAVIYLPGLGSTEIKGEEGRRILPAVTMLDGGSWLVPQVGGKPFLRKPPLVNWLIAASFKISGVRNEWSARMPSALCVLALAATIIATSTGGAWMKPETGLVAAIFAMTQFGLLAKARFAGAEIEGVYAPISGIAIVLWLAWWVQGRSPWLTWTIPFIFLGIASLAKGPSLHLVFFYSVVGAALWSVRGWRGLSHPAHFLGVAIGAAIFSAWAVPFFQSPEALEAAAVWKRQGIDRFTESDFNAGNYLLNFPRGLADQLPWLIFAPFVISAARRRSEDFPAEISGEYLPPRLLKTLAISIAGVGMVVLLIPGTLPRYVLPLGTPVAILLAVALHAQPHERLLQNWWRVNVALGWLVIVAALAIPFFSAGDISTAIFSALCFTPVLGACVFIVARRGVSLSPAQLSIGSATLMGAASIVYAVAIVPRINRNDELRPMAAGIDAAIPAGRELLIYEPGYLPVIFYLRTPYRYGSGMEQVPADVEFVLLRAQSRKKFAERRPDLRVLRSFPQKNREDVLLLQRRPLIPNDPPL